MSNESIEENKKQKQKIVVRAVHCNIKIKQIMAEIENKKNFNLLYNHITPDLRRQMLAICKIAFYLL